MMGVAPFITEDEKMTYTPTGDIVLPAPSRAMHHIPLSSPTNFSGQFIAGGGAGRVVLTNSHLELEWGLILNGRRETVDLSEQVKFDWVNEEGESHPHYFDFVVLQSDKRRIAYAVRPMARSFGSFRETMPMIAKQARASRLYSDVRHLSEKDLDPIELSNAWLFHGMRTPDPEADILAADVLAEMSGIVTLGELADRVHQGPWGFRAMIRLIRSHHLRLVRPELINSTTEVYKAENIQ